MWRGIPTPRPLPRFPLGLLLALQQSVLSRSYHRVGRETVSCSTTAMSTDVYTLYVNQPLRLQAAGVYLPSKFT